MMSEALVNMGLVLLALGWATAAGAATWLFTRARHEARPQDTFRFVMSSASWLLGAGMASIVAAAVLEIAG